MSCPSPIDLSRLADGDLAPAERRAIERHLRDCDACRGEVEDDRAFVAAVARAVCPDAETLGLFMDDALGPPRVDAVAAHVLACDPCRSVVAWTREAQAATAERAGTKSGRRRPRVRPRSALPGWLPAMVGAAAALMVVLMLARGDRRPPASGPDGARATERRTEPSPPQPTERPAPRATEAPSPPPTDAPAPTEDAPGPGEATPAPTEPPPATEPAPVTERPPLPPPAPSHGGTTTTPTPPPAPAPVLVAALPGGSLRYRDPAGAEGVLDGAASLPVGTRLLGGRQGGGLRLGEVACFVDAQSVLRLDEPREGLSKVELLEGQVSVEAPRPTIEVACGPATVRPLGGGALFVLAHEGADRAFLSVVSGAASVGGERVGAGEAARVERDRVKPVRGEGRLTKADELAVTAALAQGLDYPGGVRVRRVLAAAAADLGGGDAERRAWAAYAVLAVHRAGPRLARLAAPHLDVARRAVAELTALPAEALARAAAPLILAQGTRDADPATIVRLGEALAARPAAELAQDPDALLALRVAERLSSFKAPRQAWAAAAALPLEGTGGGARALLARRPLGAGERKQLLADLDAALAKDPLEAPADPAALLGASRTFALLGALTPERRARLLAHAGAPDRADPRLAVAVAADAAALAGAADPARDDAPASVVVSPLESGAFRVTFVFTSPRRPKHVLLCGTWDQWAEPGLPMRERADGSFTATLTLPAGRHEYKLRLGVGGVWEPDGRNPLTKADGMGGLNSVLILE